MRRMKMVISAIGALCAILSGGLVLATGYTYPGFSVDYEDGGDVKVILGRIKAPEFMQSTVERRYVRNRHALLTEVAKAQPNRTIHGIVVFRQFIPLHDVDHLLKDHSLRATHLWFGRNGALGTGGAQVINNNLNEAYENWRDVVLEMAADVPEDDISRQNAEKIDEFGVFAVQVSGPASALDQIKDLDGVRLVDVEEHPEARKLAAERGVALKFHYAPMRPDGL